MEDFVTFEIAKKLKEKGFNEGCYKYYENKELKWSNSPWLEPRYNSYMPHRISAPTISQVLKWLRKEKKYHVYAAYGAVSKFRYVIIQLDNEDAKYTIKRHYKTYEDAIMAGINYVINNII